MPEVAKNIRLLTRASRIIKDETNALMRTGECDLPRLYVARLLLDRVLELIPDPPRRDK